MKYFSDSLYDALLKLTNPTSPTVCSTDRRRAARRIRRVDSVPAARTIPRTPVLLPIISSLRSEERTPSLRFGDRRDAGILAARREPDVDEGLHGLRGVQELLDLHRASSRFKARRPELVATTSKQAAGMTYPAGGISQLRHLTFNIEK